MSKQTAVEWFWNQLPNILPFSLDNETAIKLQEAKDQALQMEKEQIENAWFDSTLQFDNSAEMTYKKDFDQYYNETYGKDSSHE